MRCLNPYRIQGYSFDCRKCIVCTSKRKKDHVYRINEMHRTSTNSVFLTLTYNDTHLPREPISYVNAEGEYKRKPNPEGRPMLVKAHLQRFIKSIKQFDRRKQGDKLKHYSVGEYGGITGRPHYHVLLMNVSDELMKRIESTRTAGLNNYLSDLWQYGHINVSKKARKGSIDYISKYIIGKYQGERPVKPFALFTQGFGKEYFNNKEVMKWHVAAEEGRALEDMRYFVVDRATYKPRKMPDYFKRKIFTAEERTELGRMTFEEMQKQQHEKLMKLAQKEGGLLKAIAIQAIRDEYVIKKLQENYMKNLTL